LKLSFVLFYETQNILQTSHPLWVANTLLLEQTQNDASGQALPLWMLQQIASTSLYLQLARLPRQLGGPHKEPLISD